MCSWLMFWCVIFWMSLFSFFFNPRNFLNLLIFAELSWVSLYCLTVFMGAINDDVMLISISFFVLGFAGIEFALGFLLVLLFKQSNVSIDLTEVDVAWDSIKYANQWRSTVTRTFSNP